MIVIGRIPEHRDAREAGNDFAHQLQMLQGHFRREQRQSRQIAAGPPNAFDKANLGRIAGARCKDDRYIFRQLGGSDSRGHDGSHDQVDFPVEKFAAPATGSVHISRHVHMLEDEVAPLDIAELAHALRERAEHDRFLFEIGGMPQDADLPDPLVIRCIGRRCDRT